MNIPHQMYLLVLVTGLAYGPAVRDANAAEPAESKSATRRAFVDSSGPGWKALGPADFVNVNCNPETWTWKQGTAYCTGQPVGVIRSQTTFTNFELLLEWRHMKKAGNSGVFVWTPAASLKPLKPGQLPHGIEVQVLDPGYTERYEKQNKKKPDWFTSHGDVFPVGSSKMKPFPQRPPMDGVAFPPNI